MKPAAAVTAVACTLVIGGLVALATPGVVSVASALSVAGSAHPASRPSVDPSSSPAAQEDTGDAGTPDGYVNLGPVAIPEGGPGDCEASAWIQISKQDDGPWRAEVLGAKPVDTGTREFASGDVGYAPDGRVATYTVAPGDAPWAIGDRFCVANGLAIPDLNGHPGYEPIQPGEVLVLDPDAVPGFEYHYPYPD